MRTSMKLLAAVAALALVACSREAEIPPRPAAAPTPQEQGQEATQAPAQAAAQPQAAPVAQAPAQPASSGWKDMALGGALGYLLGSSGSRQAPAPAPNVTYTDNRQFVNRPENVPTPRPAAPPKQWFRDRPVPDPAPVTTPTAKPVAPPSPPPAAAKPAPVTPPTRSMPSYSGPSSYKPTPPPRVTYSAPPRSFSAPSGRRR